MFSSNLQPYPTSDAGRHVDPDGFSTAFEDLSAKTRSRIFKFERLQTYDETDNESWREFEKGNLRLSFELMRKIRAKETEYDIDFFRRGRQFLRVHAVEFPLTRYLEWEFYSYLISAQYGETILIADLTNADRDGFLWNTRDFLLFDDFAVLIHEHDDGGLLTGGWLSQEHPLVGRSVELARELTAISVPLAVFLDRHTLCPFHVAE